MLMKLEFLHSSGGDVAGSVLAHLTGSRPADLPDTSCLSAVFVPGEGARGLLHQIW